MEPVTFVTGNRWKHEEARRLLAGVDVRVARLTLAKPPSDDLREVARARAADAYRQLGRPCFVENTGLYLDDHGGAPGPRFKREFLALGEDAYWARFGGGPALARVAVAHANATGVRVFEGESEGSVLTIPRGEGGYGWDRAFVPEGYTRTLAELAASKYLVNMRHAPYLELAAAIRGLTYEGVFEAHVTVAPCELAGFRRDCDALGVKCIAIELPSGAEPFQPMTASHHHGELRSVQEEVHRLARALVRAGYTVTRTKIEAVGPHPEVPQDDAAAARAPRENYFEFHVKVLLPEGTAAAELEALGALVRADGAHLSRNALKATPGSSERFVTLRVYGRGRPHAEARFAAVLASIHGRGYATRGRVREYTVYDSDLAVDRGWLGSP